MADVKNLKLVLLTPTRRMADLSASSVTLPGAEGQMEVLPGHATMVVEMGYGVLEYVHEGTRTYFALESGVAEIRDDVVTVLADSAEDAATLDVARAEKALQRAKERRTGSKAGEVVNMERAERAEARALARLAAAARLHRG